MRMVKIFIWMIVFFLMSNFIVAQSILDTKINDEVFTIGDKFKLDAVIDNGLDNDIYLQYLIYSKGGFGISNTLIIDPFFFDTVTIYQTEINKNFKNENYYVMLRLTDEMQNDVYDIKTLDFRIEGVPEVFEIELLSCKDERCMEKSKIFIVNKNIYLNYLPEVPNPEIKASLTYPNRRQEQITLPYLFKAEQIGTYELEVTASKEGYKTKTIKEQFGVIEKEAEIDYLRVDDVSKKEESKLWLWILITIVGGGIIYWLYKRFK